MRAVSLIGTALLLSCLGPGTSGAQPSYILYDPGSETFLAPNETPYFLDWPAPPDGEEQVNIRYVEPNLGQTAIAGTSLWIASLVFHVGAAFEVETLSLSVTAGGLLNEVPPSAIELSAPIVITGHLPEPTTAQLLAVGVVVLCAAGGVPATRRRGR
jgi:hypothetical protein